MITEENYLHDKNSINKAVDKVFKRLIGEYSFREGEFDEKREVQLRNINKNGFQIRIEVSAKEAYHISLIEKSGAQWGVSSRVSKIYKRGSSENKKFFRDRWDEAMNYEKYSEGFYFALINFEIKFLEKHYPSIFENGILAEK